MAKSAERDEVLYLEQHTCYKKWEIICHVEMPKEAVFKILLNIIEAHNNLNWNKLEPIS